MKKRHCVGKSGSRAKEYVLVFGRRRQYRAITKTKHEAMHAAKEIHEFNGEPTQVKKRVCDQERVIHSFGGKS